MSCEYKKKTIITQFFLHFTIVLVSIKKTFYCFSSSVVPSLEANFVVSELTTRDKEHCWRSLLTHCSNAWSSAAMCIFANQLERSRTIPLWFWYLSFSAVHLLAMVFYLDKVPRMLHVWSNFSTQIPVHESGLHLGESAWFSQGCPVEQFVHCYLKDRCVAILLNHTET